MRYHLYDLGKKAVPQIKLVASGSRGEMGTAMSGSRQIPGCNEFAIYDDRGVLMSSSHGGGASPHAWGLRSKGEGRKQSGLPFNFNEWAAARPKPKKAA